MIDTTKFIEILPGIWYEVATGKPWSKRNGKYGFRSYLKPLKQKPLGYYSVSINGTNIPWHRIVYEYFKGPIPQGMQVDHDDNNPSNNRIENLKLLTKRENNLKRKISKRNKSGYSGVIWMKDRNKFESGVTINRKRLHIGFFDTPEEAYEAYLQAKVKYHGIESISPLKGI